MPSDLIPSGRWIIARTDNKFLFLPFSSDGISHPSNGGASNSPARIILGRDPQLPMEQQLSHRSYISREHLVICGVPETSTASIPSTASPPRALPPRLHVYQVGRNPTFCGPHCGLVPSLLQDSHVVTSKGEGGNASSKTTHSSSPSVVTGVLEFVVDPSVSHPAREELTGHAVGEASESAIPVVRIKVPGMRFTDIVRLGQVGRSTERRDESTLYFPDGLQLPDLHIAFELRPTLSFSSLEEKASKASDVAGRSAASSTLSVAQMLAVPKVNFDDPEGEED